MILFISKSSQTLAFTNVLPMFNTYLPYNSGDYLASIKFNDQHIPDSPFKVQVSPKDGDIHKLNVEKIQENLLQVSLC